MTNQLNETIIQEIRKLENKNGCIKASEIVNEARSPESPLHDCFTWDNTKAAEKWRREEAQSLITRYKMIVVYEDFEIKVPYYVRDTNKEPCEEGYVSLFRVKEESAVDIVRNELSCVINLLERTVGIAEMKKNDLPKNTVLRIGNILKQLKDIKGKL